MTVKLRRINVFIVVAIVNIYMLYILYLLLAFRLYRKMAPYTNLHKFNIS